MHLLTHSSRIYYFLLPHAIEDRFTYVIFCVEIFLRRKSLQCRSVQQNPEETNPWQWFTTKLDPFKQQDRMFLKAFLVIPYTRRKEAKWEFIKRTKFAQHLHDPRTTAEGAPVYKQKSISCFSLAVFIASDNWKSIYHLTGVNQARAPKIFTYNTKIPYINLVQQCLS